MNLFIPSKLEWPERGLKLRQTTKYPYDERITFTIDSAPSSPVAFKIRIPYWAAKGVRVSINGASQDAAATPSTYLNLEHGWKAGDVIAVDIPLTLHIASTPDDKQVQAAMYGPLVLAARLGTDELTTSMIYGNNGPRGGGDGYPMPAVDLRPAAGDAANGHTAAPAAATDAWFEQSEPSALYSLQFRTKGRGLIHTLVPLNRIMDERYSVYLYVQNSA